MQFEKKVRLFRQATPFGLRREPNENHAEGVDLREEANRRYRLSMPGWEIAVLTLGP